MAIEFLNGIDLTGTLELKTLTTNTDSTTALVISGDEVQKRTLGSLAFSSATIPTDFVSAANGGTFGGNLTIENASTPTLKLIDTTDPDLEVRIRAANSYAYFEVDNANTSGSSRLQMKIDGVNTATFMPNSFQTNTEIRITDEDTPAVFDLKRKNTASGILEGQDIGRIDFLVQDTVGSTSEDTVARITVEADETHSSTNKKSRYNFNVNTGTGLEPALTIGSDKSLTVKGDLIVDGTTTTLKTETVEVEDNILQLNTTQGSPDTATAATSGISIYRGDGVTQASLIFDDADDRWDLTNHLRVHGELTVNNHIQASILYNTSDLRVLNKAGSAWLTFADRNTSASEVVYDLANVGTISTSGTITSNGVVLTGDQVLPTDFVSKSSGGTFDGNIAVQDISMGAADRFTHGSYLELSYGASNTSQFTFNADYDGAQTGTYTPHYSGVSSAGMSIVKMPSGGIGGLNFYVKNHGTTSGSHNISTFTKILELNQNGTSTFGGNVSVGGNSLTAGSLDINGTADFTGKVNFQGDAAIEGGSGYGVFKGYTANDNHFISVRGVVANSSTLSITGGHQTTFVEHADAVNEGWYFKSFTTGTYREIARIDGTNQMYLGGNKVWNAGNDGTGSGLDADLLDGQQGTHYLDYSNFTGTPTIHTDFYSVADANAQFFSALRINADRNIVSGTDLDTDLESGGTFSSYGAANTSWNAPQSYGGVVATAFTAGIRGQHFYDVRHGQSDFSDFWFRSKNNLGYSPWSKVWTNLNDGTGSGLDADKLDGQQGTYYLDYGNFTSTPTIPTDFVSAANGGTFSGNINVNGDLTVSGGDIRKGSAGFITIGDDSKVVSIGQTNEMNFMTDVNSDQTMYLNHRGYNDASTRFRSLEIRNGKGASIVNFNGSNKKSTFSGSVRIDENLKPNTLELFNQDSTTLTSSFKIYGWSTELQFTKRNLSTGAHTGTLLRLDYTSNAATFLGSISASNFSGSSEGTNTGDQDLSGYLLNTTDTFTGTLTLNHSTFGQGLVLKRNHASNAASLVFKNSTGQQGILYAISSDNQPYWRDGTTTNANKIWTSGNDGSGSGLDADLLDGQQGTHYLDYGNFTGTPTIPTDFVSKASGGTFSGNVNVFPNAGTGTFRVGRFSGQEFKLHSTDLTNTLTSIQDLDENQGHSFILNREHAGSGDDDFKIQKDGTNQLLINKDGQVTIPGNAIISGNLTVDGTTTTLNTETVEVEDNIIVLNKTASDGSATAATSGIAINRGGTTADASFIFDDADDIWDLTHNLKVAGSLESVGAFDGKGHVQAFGILYLRNNILLVNKAADNWLTFANRNTTASEAVYDLANVGTISTSGDINTLGDVHIDEGSTSAFQTTNKLRFGNTSWNNNIGLESYWMRFGCNQNEGFKFEDSTSNMLLQLNGGNSTSGNGAFSATFKGSIIPAADASLTLGTGSLRWNFAYINNALTVTDGNFNTTTSFKFNKGLVVEGSVDSGGTDMGYYQSAGTNIVLKGDSAGRSGIFFESEKDGNNINDPSDYGFIQFHSYGYDNTSGEANNLVIGVANDSTDKVVLQTPYNGGVMVGYNDATSGTGLTLSEVIHSNSSSYNNGNWDTAYSHSQSAHAPSNAEANQTAAQLLTEIKTVDGSGSGLDADTVDGNHANYSYGVGKQYDFTVNGDADKYYPIVISGTSNARMTRITVFRGYSETAPTTWNNSTHKGGLTLTYDIRVGGWGGYPNLLNVVDFGEIYSRICGGVYWTAHTMKHVVWLRGGGASYHLDCPTSGLTIEVNDSTSASNYVSSANNGTWYSYDNSNNSYDVTVSTRTQAQADAGAVDLVGRMPMRYNNTFNEQVSVTNPIHTQAWSTITSTPTTISGYGITDAATPFSGSWNGANMPGSRFGGYQANGGEIVFQQDNPGNGRMSVMTDGNFHAGENGGFYSLYASSSYNSKAGFYADASGTLQFVSDGTSALADFDGRVIAGNGSQAANNDAMLTLNATQFSGLDIKSARTEGNIGGLRYYDTASDTVQQAQFLVEVDGSYNFYNGTNGAEFRLKLNSDGHLLPGADSSYNLGSSATRWQNLFSDNVTSTAFNDGYITWTAAQLNRYGAAIELQYTPTNASTLVKIGANGSYPTIFNAYNGDATFSGNINGTGNLSLSGNGTITTGGYWHIVSAANGNGYLDAGGTIFIRDKDDSNADRITIDTATGYVGMGIANTNNQRLTLAEADGNGSHIKMNNSRSGGGYWVVGVGDTNSDSSIVDPGGIFFYNGSTKLKISSAGDADFAGTVKAPYITASNPNGAANGAAQEVARFVNVRSGATSSYMYIGASSGTDWRLGKNINGTTNNTNFAITKHSGTTLFFEIDGVGNTTTYGTGNFGNGVSLSGNLNFSGGTGKKIVLGSQRAYTLPAQNTKMRILTLANHTSCRVYIDSSENAYNQPIVLDIYYNSQSSQKPVMHRNNHYTWHTHSNDIRFTSDTSGHIYAEKVAHATGRTVNIRKVEEFKGTVTLLDGSTTQTGGGANEVIEGAFGRLQAHGNIDVNSSGVIKMGGTEVISANRAINATLGTFSGETTFNDTLNVKGNILLTGDATTTNQGRVIDFTGFDKEGTTDFSDRAFISHTTNIGGHTGSVLQISSQNDVGDGIAFTTHASSLLRHNGDALFSEGHLPTWSEIESKPSTFTPSQHTQSATTITSGVLDAGRLPANLQNVAATSDASGIYFRNTTEVISGEGWCTGHYAYNHNDGFLFNNRNSSTVASPVFHIGGYNNAEYAGYAAQDSIITLTRSDGTKTTGSAYAGKALSSSSYYTNIVKTTTKTVFNDAQGLHEFTGAAGTPTGSFSVGSASDTNQRNLHLHAYVANKSSTLKCTDGNLHIDSADGHALYLNYYAGASTNINFGNSNNGVCGSLSSSGLLRVGNDVVAYYSFSDKRLKKDIKTTENNLDKILSLRPVEYKWKEGPREGVKEIGLIAQEVEKVVPEVVRVQSRHDDENYDEGVDYKQVDYEHLVSTLIGAMQEQQDQINDLKKEIQTLKSK